MNDYLNRGLAYLNKGDTDRAIADSTKASQLDPKYARPFINRGLAYLSKNDFDRAIANFTQVIKIDPKNVKAYINRDPHAATSRRRLSASTPTAGRKPAPKEDTRCAGSRRASLGGPCTDGPCTHRLIAGPQP